MSFQTEQIAEVIHETDRLLCRLLGLRIAETWRGAEPHQRETANFHVQYRLDHPSATAAEQHDAWVAVMVRKNWKLGDAPDMPTAKLLPNLKPYAKLGAYERLRADQAASLSSGLASLVARMAVPSD